MAKREETFLERRARLKTERETQPDQYAKSLTAGRDRAAQSTKLASSRTLSASKDTERPKSELKRQMEEIQARNEGRTRGDKAEERRNKARDEARAARDKDAQVRFDTKKAAQDNSNMQALQSIFKDQTNKIVEAIKKASKDETDAIKKIKGGGKDDGDLFDLIDDFGDGKNKKRGRRGRSRATPRGARGFGTRVLDALEEGGGRLAGTRSTLNAAKETAERGLSAAKGVGSKALGYGSRALGAVGSAGSRIYSALGEAAAPILKAGGKAAGAVGNVGKSVLGSVGGIAKAAGPVALLTGAYDVYNTVTDDTKTGGEKAQGVANIAGGTAGGVLGAELGAAVGTAIFPVVGTAVGGIVGGVAGYFGGEKFVQSLGDGVKSLVADSKLGDALGKTAAIAMSPFSQDARDALTHDWNENILPAMNSMFAPLSDLGSKLKDYTEALEQAGGQILGGARAAASSIWSGIKSGAGKIGEGYDKGGFMGAIRSLGGAGREVGKGASKAYGEASDAVKLAGKTLGAVSEKYESGGKGVGTVSSGAGDAGGVSYGKYQLASANGSMSSFLKSKEGAGIAQQLQGLQPGTKEFSDKYKQLTQSPEGAKAMEDAQHAYIQRTHFEPQAAKLQADLGLDVSKRGKAVQEAVWSTSVQYGKDSSVISKALQGKDVANMSDKDLVAAIQDYKAANVDSNFKSSSGTVKDGVRARIEREKKDLVAMADLKDAKGGTTDGKDTTAKVSGLEAQLIAKGYTPEQAAAERAKLQGKPMGSADPAKNIAQVDVKKTQPLSEVRSGDRTAAIDPKSAVNVTQATANTSSSPDAVRMADARPAQVPTVNPNTPTEPVSMAKISAAESQVASNSTTNNTVVQGGGESSHPSLAEVPMYINDMGLVLLNIGHV